MDARLDGRQKRPGRKHQARQGALDAEDRRHRRLDHGSRRVDDDTGGRRTKPIRKPWIIDSLKRYDDEQKDESKTVPALPFAGHYGRTRTHREATIGPDAAHPRNAALPLVRGLRGTLPPHARPLSDAVGGLRTPRGFPYHPDRPSPLFGVQFVPASAE